MAETIRWGASAPSVLLRVTHRTGRLTQADLDEIDKNQQVVPADLDTVLTDRYLDGKPVTIVAAVDRGMGQALYARRPDLRGATIAVDHRDGGGTFLAYALAESLGLSRDDYRASRVGPAPERLASLRAGECNATLLNGVEGLHAEAAGFRALARVGARRVPYLGTVLTTTGGDGWQGPAAALTATATEICSGTTLDQLVVDEAQSALGIPFPMAIRYLDLLKSPAEGLVPDGRVDRAAVGTAIALRRRYGPSTPGDPFGAAREPDSRLIAGAVWP
jgi:hypothetical protein